MQNAKLYTKNNDVQKMASRNFYNFFADILKNKFENREITLLDIGSGCGKILSEVTVRESGLKFSKIIGVDKSEKMLKFSNDNYGSDLMSFFYMDVSDCVAKSLKDQKFDMIISFACLHHVRDLQQAFKNIYDLLADDGIFGFTFFQSHIFMKAWDALTDKYPVMSTWRNCFSELFKHANPDMAIRDCLINCGFEIIEYHDNKNENYEFQTEEQLKSKYICYWGHISVL